jgi:hypothetical protein
MGKRIMNWYSFFKRILSAAKMVEFDSDGVLYTILRGRRCDITVLNIHVPVLDKINDMMISFWEKLEHVLDKFSEHYMKMLLGDFNAKLDTEGILKPTIGPESLHEISNDNVVRVVNFVTSRNLIV